MDKRVIYYTCNFGNYDNWDYPEGTLVFSQDTGTRRDSRFYKINSHFLPPHDVSVYFDASRKWHKHPNDLAEQLEKDWGAFVHPVRSCIYSEMNEVKGSMAEPDLVEGQKKRYNKEGYPLHKGLYENSIIVRRNTEKIKEINELWWGEYMRGCQRDQVSLPYVMWKLNYKPQLFKNSGHYAVYQGHKGSRFI